MSEREHGAIYASCDVIDILSEIVAERKRQDRLKAEGKFKFTCADANIRETEAAAILCEEVGEVAREALAWDGLEAGPADRKKLRTELIQVAAVAVAWIEKLDKAR